ncbi:MAG: hypothetical protein H6671_10615 [Anaerolineaceae bacterium]|nr:hypothetical protein [Anaerolineaceae bacterium]
MDSLFASIGNMTTIIIAITVIITVVVLFFVFRIMRNVSNMTRGNMQLLMTGESAQATVVSLNDAGMLVNNNPMVNLILNVEPSNRPAYQAAVRTMVPMIKLAQVQPGMKVAVRIDPTNPANVALELR